MFLLIKRRKYNLAKTMLFLQVIQYREQNDIEFALFVKSHLDNPTNLDEIMTYSLTPVPYSLGTSDVFFSKSNKAAMFHCIMKSVPYDVTAVSYPKEAFRIQDGNAMVHALTYLPSTFREICLCFWIKW